MPKLIDGKTWQHYFELRNTMGYREAALAAGINPSSAHRLENIPSYNSSGRPYLEAWRKSNPGPVRESGRLSRQAQRALDDFAYFRLRYFGRKSTPWQIHAADQVVEALKRAQETLDPQFVVINVAPGSGKSQMFGHDLVAWLICRDRSITVFIGSAAQDRAKDQTKELLTTFERTEPTRPNRKQKFRGAVDAEACLLADFGRFKPDNGRNWAEGAFTVAQENGESAVGKEATAAAVGRDTNYLGLRPDIVIWDDLVNEETSGTPESREKTKRKYQREAEPRVELGGVMILQGQRQFPDDLYRTCIDALAGDEDDPTAKKYTHIVYKAHYDEVCKGLHGKNDPAYDPAHPDAGGCLIDPRGVSWHRLQETKASDAREGKQDYRIVYQQENGDPTMALVNPLWIEGGEDPKTGERFIGCWDKDRPAGTAPKYGPDCISVVTIDSSPTKFWALQWWLVHPATGRRALVDMHRSRMKTYDVLSLNLDSGMFSGILEDWYWSSQRQGYPIQRLIFEANDSEVFFLDGVEIRAWQQQRRVLVTRHKTNTNKSDPNYGVQSVGPIYRHGLVRLPGDVASGSRAKLLPLITEVTNWPQASTTDCLMAQWFLEFNMPNIARANNPLPNQPRPGVVKTLPRRPALTLASRRTA